MNATHRVGAKALGWALLVAGLLVNAGCTLTERAHRAPCVVLGPPVPRELAQVSQPPYVIQPPDILLIDAVRTVPLPPYRIEPLDALYIKATNAFPTDPIDGIYVIEPEGTVSLGLAYGSVRLADLTIEEAQTALENHLKQIVKPAPKVFVGLAQFRGSQQITGEHIVHADGTVTLGIYGAVRVADMTMDQAKATIENHLSKYLLRPEIALDVGAYNSKVFYVITDGAGFGEQVVRLPSTGRETVLDVISQINGLPVVSSKKIWVARPDPGNPCSEKVLAVDWKAITRGSSQTNYQIFPGDRVYVRANPLIVADTFIARLTAPVERVFGVLLLGNAAIQSFQRGAFNNNGGF